MGPLRRDVLFPQRRAALGPASYPVGQGYFGRFSPEVPALPRLRTSGHLGGSIQRPSWVDIQVGVSPFPGHLKARWWGETVCNLYSQTEGQQAIRDAARAMQDRLGNLPPLPAIFPDKMAPIVRGNGQDREMIMARWGFLPPPHRPGSKPSTRPVTNVRNTDSRHWTPWLKKPEQRCLVPVTSFSEPDNRAGDDKPSIWAWFARSSFRRVAC